MPNSEYSFLSDRQREFLNDPDSFDSQRAAELSYRIRRKYESADEGMQLLHEHAEVWDKMSASQSAVVECVFSWGGGPEQFEQCDSSVVVDAYLVKGATTGVWVEQTPDGWANVPIYGNEGNDNSRADMRTWAVCPECRSQAREYVRQHGAVPCTDARHNAHRVGSSQFKKCSRNVALTMNDLRQLRESGNIDGRLPDEPLTIE